MLLHLAVIDDQPHIAAQETVIAAYVSQVEHYIVYAQRDRKLTVGVCKAAVAVRRKLRVGGLDRLCRAREGR